MARKRALPLIEDFDNIPEEALVPEAEQPYPIPDHWKWVRIGSVAVTSKEKVGVFFNGQRHLGLENLESGGGIKSFANAFDLKSAKSVFAPGNVLYGRLRPYLDKHTVVDCDGVCSTDILVYSPTPALNADYFNYWLSTSTFRNAAVSQSTGMKPRVLEATLAVFPIPLPPLREQRQIVDHLNGNLEKIDKVIARLKSFMVETKQQKENLIQAAMHGHLIKNPVENQLFSPQGYVPLPYSEKLVHRASRRKNHLPLIEDFDNIPEEALVPETEQPYAIPEHWKWVKLGSVTLSMESRKPEGQTFTYIEIESIDNSNQTIKEVKVVATSKAPSRAKRAVHAGDVLFSLVRPYLRNIALIDERYSHAIASTGFYICTPVKKILNSEFLFEVLRCNSFVEIITDKMKGDKSPSVKIPDMQNLAIPLPPLREQRQIVDQLKSNIDALSAVNTRVEKSLAVLSESRQSLVSAALVGRFSLDFDDMNNEDPPIGSLQEWE